MKRILLICLLASVCNQCLAAKTFTLNSSAKTADGVLPATYSCSGQNISPDLIWSGEPAATQAHALIVKDPDVANGPFYHWVLYNIPKDIHQFQANQTELPEGTIVGMNNFSKLQYSGPCPNIGAAHRYYFTLYALDARLNLSIGRNAKLIDAEIGKHMLEKAEFVAIYRHY